MNVYQAPPQCTCEAGLGWRRGARAAQHQYPRRIMERYVVYDARSILTVTADLRLIVPPADPDEDDLRRFIRTLDHYIVPLSKGRSRLMSPVRINHTALPCPHLTPGHSPTFTRLPFAPNSGSSLAKLPDRLPTPCSSSLTPSPRASTIGTRGKRPTCSTPACSITAWTIRARTRLQGCLTISSTVSLNCVPRAWPTQTS